MRSRRRRGFSRPPKPPNGAEIGPVEIEVPRDTNSSVDPQIVKKRQRRLPGIDEIVLS
jgi:transposase-like protein